MPVLLTNINQCFIPSMFHLFYVLLKQLTCFQELVSRRGPFAIMS